MGWLIGLDALQVTQWTGCGQWPGSPEHMWHCSAGSEIIAKTKSLQQFMVDCLPPALASFTPPNALALALAMQGGHDSEDIKESTM